MLYVWFGVETSVLCVSVNKGTYIVGKKLEAENA